MSTISMLLVKELRNRSGAGMMSCKKALLESNGDLESAMSLLRKQGLSLVIKKSLRNAKEGLVSLLIDGTKGVLIEINSETDFVARNHIFQDYVREVTQLFLTKSDNVIDLNKEIYPLSSRTFSEELNNLISIMGEKIYLRRNSLVKVNEGVVSSYIHTSISGGMGKIGVLVGIDSAGNKEKLKNLGKKIAMHIAAMKPQALTRNMLPVDIIERENELYKDQAINSGKPKNIIKNIVEGRLRKFYEEVVLLEQNFVLDTNRKVLEVIKDVEQDIGSKISISSFSCFVLGESV